MTDHYEESLDALAHEMVKEPDLWRCTVCGRIGTVGRCCGEETRERANMEQLLADAASATSEPDADLENSND